MSTLSVASDDACRRPAADTVTQWELVPASDRDIAAITAACRAMVTRNALVAAGAAVVPLPGLDIATDAALLLRLIPQINARFGLTPAQIERLSVNNQLIVYKAITAVGGAMIGKLITHELIIHALKIVGVRLTVKQATKYVPLAGQAVSAALSFSALRYVCNQHIKQCAQVAGTLMLEQNAMRSSKADFGSVGAGAKRRVP
jgi:uncharacterized protein (DUF697 family)